MSKGHALVVGGTGMLWGVSLELARHGYVVSVIARRKAKLNELAEAARVEGGIVHPIAVDVLDESALTKALKDAIERFGPIRLTVDWVSPNDSLTVARLIGSEENPVISSTCWGAAPPTLHVTTPSAAPALRRFPTSATMR